MVANELLAFFRRGFDVLLDSKKDQIFVAARLPRASLRSSRAPFGARSSLRDARRLGAPLPARRHFGCSPALRHDPDAFLDA